MPHSKNPLQIRLSSTVLLLVSLIIIFNSCYKEAELKNETYYFLRGVFINDTFPVARLFKNSLNYEIKLNPQNYDVIISSDIGETETMKNEVFTKIKLRVGRKYTVKWKLKEEKTWNSLDKFIPYPDTMNIIPSNLITETERLYFRKVNIPQSDMFFWGQDYSTSTYNITDFQYMHGIYLWGGVKRYFLMNRQNESGEIQIYPSDIWNNINYSQPFEPCMKPFTWFEGSELKSMRLVQCSIKDIELFKQINQNNFKIREPLYVGEPIQWDYNNGANFGHIFSFYKYDNIKLIDFVPPITEEEGVTYNLTYQGKPIDTTKIKVSVGCYFGYGNYTGGFNQTSSVKKQLFYKDYIASYYNYHYQKPCGYYSPEYTFKVYVSYQFLPETIPIKVFQYLTEDIIYKNKSFHLDIDIP